MSSASEEFAALSPPPATGPRSEEDGPAPPPKDELLAHFLHAAVTLRLYGAAALQPVAGRALARLLRAVAIAREDETASSDAAAAAAIAAMPHAAAAIAAAGGGSAGAEASARLTLIDRMLAPPPPLPPPAADPADGGGGGAGDGAAEHAATAPLVALVGELLRALGRPPALAASWATIALRHASVHLRVGAPMVSDGEGGGGGGAEGGGGGTPADTLWVASSLAAHRALLSELNSAWLPAHGRSLAHAACVCALRPRPRTLSLAHHALLGVEALLRHASRATPHRAAALLAHVFWRASVLLYSDAIPLYSHAARVLAAVAAPPPHGSPLAATLGAAPLAAPTFTAALAATAPPFWASSPTEARASTNPFSPMPGGAVGGGGGGGSDGGCARFPGLQLLLLRGAGEGRTRDACVRLARLCAACGGEASAALEAEGSRLLTAAALVLPSLCAAPDADAPPPAAAAAASATPGGPSDVFVAAQLASGCSAARQHHPELNGLGIQMQKFASELRDFGCVELSRWRERLEDALV